MSEVNSPISPSTETSSPQEEGFQGQRFLDQKGWEEEARGVIKEIKDYVRLFTVSEKVPATDSEIFFNLITLEETCYTIRLSELGFSVVGLQLDTVPDTGLEEVELAGQDCTAKGGGDRFYETPHALLDNLSLAYRKAWGNHLALQLLKLQAESEDSKQD